MHHSYVLCCLGQFFEVLIGVRPEPLWRLLGQIGILYALEPILTITFVTNMNIMWEKIMSTLRAQIFGRILMQKVGLVLQISSSLIGVIFLNTFEFSPFCFVHW